MSEQTKKTAASAHARARILAALAVVDGAAAALRSARAELIRLDTERERGHEAALDVAYELSGEEEHEAETDRLADDAERLNDAQDGLPRALETVEAAIDTLRSEAVAPLRRSARRLKPPASGALECLAEVGGRR